MLSFGRFFQCLVLVLIFEECKAKKYCSASVCNNTKQHTMCKFPSANPATHCEDFEMTIKSAREKQAILDKLNNRRHKVAAGELKSLPSAENMMKLEWSEELEVSAQRWANQCVKLSSPDIQDTCRDLGSMYVGQNIATIYGEAPGLSPIGLVDVWYMELLKVNSSVIPRYQRSPDAGYAHYEYFTQLVWANSRLVGCGGVKFKERLQDSGSEKKRAIHRLVCNFAPGGNVVNQPVYSAGPSCSQCPQQTCDAQYPALCSSESEITQEMVADEDEAETITTKKTTKRPKKISKAMRETKLYAANLEAIDMTSSKNEDDEFKPYEYFSHSSEFVRPTLVTITIDKKSPCKDLMVVDDFVEILKKKLSTDPMFKELLQTTTMNAGNVDNPYTDAMVLLSKIYSPKVSSTTEKVTEKDYLNSTLLVDLVEAVIFRSGDKIKVTPERIKTTQPELDVSPIKIQAELAEVRRNSDFTGHLFFPEDVDDDTTDAIESYYDVPNPSVPEKDLEPIRRSKATRDFLDEILDTEMGSENVEEKNVIITKRELTKELKSSNDPIDNPNDYYDNIHEDFIADDRRPPPKNFEKNLDAGCGIYLVKYSDLLKKLAADLKPLKLNTLFHCTRNNSQKSVGSVIYTFMLIIKYILS